MAVGISLFSLVMMTMALGVTAVPTRAIRLTLTIVLMIALYRGSRVAYWLTVILFSISVILTPFLLRSPSLPLLSQIVLGFMFVFYLAFVITIVAPTPVRRYLLLRREWNREMQWRREEARAVRLDAE